MNLDCETRACPWEALEGEDGRYLCPACRALEDYGTYVPETVDADG